MFLNKAIIYGNITRDPELKSLPSGIQVGTFSVATNRVWKDKSGAKQESSDFHNVVVFGKQAELVAQYLRKGSGVFVEGRMQTRSWDGADGQKRYRTEVVADRIQFGPKGASGGGGYSGSGSTSGKSAASPDGGSQANAKVDKNAGIDTIEYPSEEINPEDIPF